jgi:hypothetical protein
MKKIILFALVAVSFASCATKHTYTAYDVRFKNPALVYDYDQFVPGQIVWEGRTAYVIISEVK